MSRRRIIIRSKADTGQWRRIVRRNIEPGLFDAMMQAYKDYKMLPGDYPEFLWPTEFPGIVTQPFGANPDIYKPLGVPAHEGIDMKAPEKSQVFAVWDGVVSRKENHIAYGHHIRIKHVIYGIEYESIYAHFAQPSSFEVGDKIIKGTRIGLADSTGNSTGSHLHFGLKQFNGELPDTEMQKKYNWPYNIVDPTPFFKELN